MCKNIIRFSQLSDNQIINLMLGSLMASTKQITQENQVTFPNEKQSSVTTNEILTPDEFHSHLETLLPSNLCLHMNISSMSYHIDDLKSLITNCQFKPKIIGISECRLKKLRCSFKHYYRRLYLSIHNCRFFKRLSLELHWQ